MIPVVMFLMCKDIAVKQEGILTWHRDSFGELLQRFILCVLVLVAIVIFENCAIDKGH